MRLKFFINLNVYLHLKYEMDSKYSRYTSKNIPSRSPNLVLVLWFIHRSPKLQDKNQKLSTSPWSKRFFNQIVLA